MPLSANTAAWRQFTAQTGDWMVEWNPVIGNPHRAYGGKQLQLEQINRELKTALAAKTTEAHQAKTYRYMIPTQICRPNC